MSRVLLWVRVRKGGRRLPRPANPPTRALAPPIMAGTGTLHLLHHDPLRGVIEAYNFEHFFTILEGGRSVQPKAGVLGEIPLQHRPPPGHPPRPPRCSNHRDWHTASLGAGGQTLPQVLGDTSSL